MNPNVIITVAGFSIRAGRSGRADDCRSRAAGTTIDSTVNSNGGAVNRNTIISDLALRVIVRVVSDRIGDFIVCVGDGGMRNEVSRDIIFVYSSDTVLKVEGEGKVIAFGSIALCLVGIAVRGSVLDGDVIIILGDSIDFHSAGYTTNGKPVHLIAATLGDDARRTEGQAACRR